ncbi:MAG: DUF4258 domain-containing protein [Oscillospiraceae bacterium]|nr:DUF4258 domain-containing protein [Oscillospiraceae bacterium]
MLNIADLRNLCCDKSIAVTKHARIRLIERGITIGDVQNAAQTGEIIKQYEDDAPFPSCLLLGKTEQNKYIHIVASIDSGYLYVITAYYPDENEWESNLKIRKGQ